MKAIAISLSYLNKETFDLLRAAQKHNPDLIAMMPMPKLTVNTSGKELVSEIPPLELLEAMIKTSIKTGEHHDIVLATLFNVITNLQKAIYQKYNTGLHNNKLTKHCTQLLRIYCETRAECDSSIVKLDL